MNSTRHLLRLRTHKLHRSFCSKPETVALKKVSHKNSLIMFFVENKQLTPLKKHIPQQFFSLRRQGVPEILYLVCPNIAKTIADHVEAALPQNSNHVVAETNAGLGLIATELLEKGIESIRLYESCSEFMPELKDFVDIYPGRVKLFNKDLFHLYRYAFIDKQDHGNRVEEMLSDVPKSPWTDEPVMTVVGAMPSLKFITYLIKSICLQQDISSYGRLQVIAAMRPRHYAVLSATPEQNLRAYQYWTVLFNLLFDYELLEKLPRKFFLPWESEKHMNHYPANLDVDQLYLVKFVVKKQLPVDTGELLPLFYFLKYFYGKGTNRVIPTAEKRIADCGLNILIPKLKHESYFKDINIFTQFRELTPHEILAVFKELINCPSYTGSIFMEMIETEFLKKETIETSLADAHTKKNEKIVEEKVEC